MKKAKILKMFILGVLVLAFVAQVTVAQQKDEKKEITSKAKSDSSATAKSDTSSRKMGEEIMLMTIRIEAVVEKPGVSLIPKKLKTDVGQVEFAERSFDHELKSKPKEVPETAEELESEKKIEKLMKLIGKKK